MTRFSFILFNVLLVGAVYGLAGYEGGKEQAVTFTLVNFSVPYIAVIIAMAILSTLRWFMGPDEEIMKSAVTYWHAAWISTLLTFIAVKLVSAGGLHVASLKSIGNFLGH